MLIPLPTPPSARPLVVTAFFCRNENDEYLIIVGNSIMPLANTVYDMENIMKNRLQNIAISNGK